MHFHLGRLWLLQSARIAWPASKKTGFGAAGALCLGHRVIPFWLWQKYQVLGEFAAVLQLPFIMKMQAEPTNVISRCK
jgi:hypothetical protein